MDRNDLQEQIQNARALGQKLEGLVVNAGKITIKTEASPFLIGLWSLICDYDKGLLNLLHWKFYGAAFALWRPFVEATVRAHLSLMLPPDDLGRLKRDKYRVNFKTVTAEIDQAFGLGKLFENFLPERVRVALHSYTHSGVVPLMRRFDGADVAAKLPRPRDYRAHQHDDERSLHGHVVGYEALRIRERVGGGAAVVRRVGSAEAGRNRAAGESVTLGCWALSSTSPRASSGRLKIRRADWWI